ncbi:SPFH domain-containing protein [Streptomyces sp. NPDC054841]
MTPYPEDPPRPPLPLTRLRGASVSVHQAGLPVSGALGDPTGPGDSVGSGGPSEMFEAFDPLDTLGPLHPLDPLDAFDPLGALDVPSDGYARGPYAAVGVYGVLAGQAGAGAEAGPPCPGENPHAHADADAHVGAAAEAVGTTEPLTRTQLLTKTETKPAVESAAETEAESLADTEAKAEVETLADTEAKAEAETVAEAEAVAESLTKAEAETVAVTLAEAEADTEAKEEAGELRAVGASDGVPGPIVFERQLSGVGGRRAVVIGSETTGPIPAHLLFRDSARTPDGSAAGPGDSSADGGEWADWAGKAGKAGKADGGDGGPDTIAMARVSLPTGRRATTTLVAPSRRPAPPADPRLNERPGPVLPGWAALLTGVAAMTGCAAVLHWAGGFPGEVTELFGLAERPYHALGFGQWALLALGVSLLLFSLGGLGRGRAGHAWVLTLYGEYRGSVRRTGLMWVSPLLLRRRVDVRLRHWRSEPMPAVDSNGTSLQVVVLVVWRIRDTARAVLGVADHEAYLREQVEAATARVLSQLPADAFQDPATSGFSGPIPTLRNAEAVGDSLTKTLSAECAPVGIDIFSAQPTRIEYAPEVAPAMRRRRIAVIEAEQRDTVLTSVVDAVDDTVQRLTRRGLVELDDYERKALVRDLTVAFCTARAGGAEAS